MADVGVAMNKAEDKTEQMENRKAKALDEMSRFRRSYRLHFK